MKKSVTILAIETSCDETAASVLRGTPGSKQPAFNILSSVVRSQIKLHRSLGGVVPEAAARAHVSAIRPTVEKALRDAFPHTPYHLSLANKVDFIAVTAGPGLVASLLVGVEFAKALAIATGKPMLAVNHMEGHLYSPFGENISKINPPAGGQKSKIQFPVLSLIVSGGHTLLVLQKNEKDYRVLGSTVDDAAGEAFDKIAKLLELPYPGGPEISKLAAQGSIAAAGSIKLPRPMLNSTDFDFSFSGLKTAVLYYLQDTYAHLSPVAKTGKNRNKTTLHNYRFGQIPLQDKRNIALAFETAAVDVLVTKAVRAASKYNCKTISLSGGVAANKRLRTTLTASSLKLGARFIVPDFRLCTDNAEMIAIAAYFQLRHNTRPTPYSKIKANSNWEIS